MKLENKTEPLIKLQACLKDKKTWMQENILLLNFDKTEVVVLVPNTLGAD